ncbi:MAG TPA: polysaccharide deacetylase [Egibacteraceae bacterium]|nr:polysaccharide deacetylase [Egibacteraceae bacterium]
MWPDAHRSAVAFTFDFDAEEVWIGEDPANASKPGVLSQGTYGAKVAVPLILDLLQRHRVPATFFVPGRVAERHPQRVSAIVEAGHELAHHGYTHTSPTQLSRDQEEHELLKGREVLEAFGAEVVGYRSPSWDLSPNTLDLLTTHGFSYASNLMDDIRPYRHADAPLIEIPIQWILDDAPHFWFDGASWNKKISTVEEVRSIWLAELHGIHELGGCCVFTMHPQIIGRPGRLPLLEELITTVTARDDMWVATCHDIAQRVTSGVTR